MKRLPYLIGIALLMSWEAGLAAPPSGRAASAPAAGPAAAPAAAPVAASAPSGEDAMIKLNLPATVEVKLLIEFVSRRLGINIVYDEGAGATRVAISAPAEIRVRDLLPLLDNILKMAGLELVDSAQPGWKTIGRKVSLQFVAVRNVNVGELAKRVGDLIGERDRIGGAGRLAMRVAGPKAASAASIGGELALVPDAKTGQIAVIGTESAAREAIKLIESLDVASDLATRSYRFRHVSPARVDSLLRGRTGAGVEGSDSYASIVDENSGLLIVTASPAVHKMVELLTKELDVETDPSRGTIQFYKLINTTATDVLATLRGLQGREGGIARQVEKREADAASRKELTSGYNPLPGQPPGGGNMAAPSGATAPPGVNETVGPAGTAGAGVGTNPPPAVAGTAATPPGSGAGGQGTGAPGAPEGQAPAGPGAGEQTSPAAALTQKAIVTADLNTNSIIVIAPPDVQKVYRQLIAKLDKRRPQVLVEVTLVTVDTSNDFTLGVELSGFWHNNKTSGLVFSSFGLSTVDPTTGKPTITPGPGFNGVLLAPDAVSAVIQAVADNSRSRVVSAPKIMMNDNATGTLASVAEEPYTSTNALTSNLSTTSFAGYATAGTTVAITPHISEGDYLQLKYSVALNTFTGDGSGGIPPPRQTDNLDSEVTIPNGYAVVVGGLTRKENSEKFTKVPFLGDIPIIQQAFQLQNRKNLQSTLFVFIRPVILRDDKFEDLKFLSDHDLMTAALPPNMPVSEPLVMP